MTKSLLTALVMGAALAGCGGTPNVYYTLTANSGQAAAAQAPAAQAPGLYTLGTVNVPAPVDDTMLVVRQSDDKLMKLAHDRWTAPLGKQVSNALAVALTRQLGMPPLSSAQASGKQAPVTKFSVDIQRFDLVPGQFAALTAVWQIRPGASTRASTPASTTSTTSTTSNKSATSLTCYTELRQSVEPGVAPLVKAQQRNIEQLAQAMSSVWQMGSWPASTRCQ